MLNKEKLRRIIRISEKLHMFDELTYEQFKRIYIKFGSQYGESEFATIFLDISLSEFEKIQATPGEKTNVLVNEPLPSAEKIQEIRNRIVEDYFLHKDDEITFSVFQEMYPRYAGALNQELFASLILSIDKDKLDEMRNDSQKRCRIYKDVDTSGIIKELKRQIVGRRKKSNPQEISPTIFMNLYKQQIHILSAKEFAVKVLGMKITIYKEIRECAYQRYIKLQLREYKDEFEAMRALTIPQSFILGGPNQYKKSKIKLSTQANKSNVTDKTPQLGERVLTPKKLSSELKPIIREGKMFREKVGDVFEKKVTKKPLTEDDRNNMRKYITNCFERAENNVLKKDELDDLEECLRSVSVEESDVLKYSKICVSFGEHQVAKDFCDAVVSGECSSNIANMEKIKSLQKALERAIKRRKALEMINKGESDLTEIATKTKLPKEEIEEMYKRLQTDKSYDQEVLFGL